VILTQIATLKGLVILGKKLEKSLFLAFFSSTNGASYWLWPQNLIFIPVKPSIQAKQVLLGW
jgi:hypothetical protein